MSSATSDEGGSALSTESQHPIALCGIRASRIFPVRRKRTRRKIVTDNYLKSNIGQVKLATAVLIASVVQTLNESDPTFRKRFEEHLAEWGVGTRGGSQKCI